MEYQQIMHVQQKQVNVYQIQENGQWVIVVVQVMQYQQQLIYVKNVQII